MALSLLYEIANLIILDHHLLCANCGKAFETYAHEQKYCSMACYHEMRDVKKEKSIQIIDEARCSQDERLRRKETLKLKKMSSTGICKSV